MPDCGGDRRLPETRRRSAPRLRLGLRLRRRERYRRRSIGSSRKSFPRRLPCPTRQTAAASPHDISVRPKPPARYSALPFAAIEGRAAGLRDAADALGAGTIRARLAFLAVHRPAMLEIAELAVRLDIVAQ